MSKYLFQDSFIVYYFITSIVLVGAMLNHMLRIDKGELKEISIRLLFLDMFISIFIALVVFSICHGIGLNEWVSAGLIGISVKRELGFFNVIERLLLKFIELKFKKD